MEWTWAGGGGGGKGWVRRGHGSPAEAHRVDRASRNMNGTFLKTAANYNAGSLGVGAMAEVGGGGADKRDARRNGHRGQTVACRGTTSCNGAFPSPCRSGRHPPLHQHPPARPAPSGRHRRHWRGPRPLRAATPPGVALAATPREGRRPWHRHGGDAWAVGERRQTPGRESQWGWGGRRNSGGGVGRGGGEGTGPQVEDASADLRRVEACAKKTLTTSGV